MKQVESKLQAATKERTSAFGATSLKLGCCAILLLWITGSVLTPVVSDEISMRAAFWTGVVSSSIVTLAGFSAFGMGAASLLGYGRERGTSRPLHGFFGMLAGFAYGPFLLFALVIPMIR